MQDDQALHGGWVPFDSIGERYDKEFTERDAQLTAGDWVLRHTTAGDRVLDLGCGTGAPTAVQLHAAGREVVAVDHSARMLELGRDRLPEVKFVHRDLRSLPEPDDSFHAVVAFFSLLMLPRRDIEAVLAKISWLLVPGGPFALSMVEGDLDGVTIPLLGTEVPVSAYPGEELVAVVHAAGFCDIELEQVRVDFADRVENQLYLRARAC